MTEYARQNGTNRYGDKNLSKVYNKGIRAGRRHCSGPSITNLNKPFSRTKIETECTCKQKPDQSHKQNTRTRCENR